MKKRTVCTVNLVKHIARYGGSLLLVGLLLACGMPGRAAAQAGWTFPEPMPQPARAYLAAAVLDGRIYVVGGRDGTGQVLARVDRYDPALGVWETGVPPLPAARYSAAAAALDGRLYVLGGHGADGAVLADVTYYDPADGRWHAAPALQMEREGLSAVVLDGVLYAMGGSDAQGNLLSSVEWLDVEHGTWREVDMWRFEFPRAAFAAVAWEYGIFSFGGFTPAPIGFIQLFQKGQSPVTRVPPGLFQARGSLGAVVLRDRIYIIGGRGPGGGGRGDAVLDDVLIFRPYEEAWEEGPPLNTARESFAAVALDTQVYVLGGQDAFGLPLRSVEMLEARPISTGTETPPSPAGFLLAPGYPNPFTAQITLAFELPAGPAAPVVLAVYDAYGRPVATLVDGVRPPGRHEVVWDGTGPDGRRLASGVYFYRLRQGAHTRTGTMTLIR